MNVLRALSLASCLSLAAQAQPLSQRMIDSIIGRQQGVVSSGESTSTLESGFLALTLESAANVYQEKQSTYTAYLDRVLDIASASLGSATKDALLPLDRLSVGLAITDASQSQAIAKMALSTSLQLQERNYMGGFLYYASAYPTLSYLDGLFSLLPYMVAQPAPNYTDASRQLSLLVSHCYQKSSGLLTHGYDANFTYPWLYTRLGRVRMYGVDHWVGS